MRSTARRLPEVGDLPLPTMKKQSYIFLFVISAAFLVVFGNRFLPFPERIHAQLPPASTEEASLDRRVEAFFRHLMQSSTSTATEAAFEEIFQDGSQVPRTSSEAVENMSKKFTDLSNSEIGRLHDHEKIGSKPIGKDVIVLKYLTKHDRAPVLWSFMFYRSPPPRTTGTTSTTTPPMSASNTWNLILVRLDTDLESAM